jgi:hypothetical protein
LLLTNAKRPRILAILGAVVTAHDSFVLIRGWSHDHWFSTTAALLAVIAILLAFWNWLLRPVAEKDFRLGDHVERITLAQDRYYKLSAKGAEGTWQSTYVFLEEPKDESLCDLFSVEGQQVPNGFWYESPDSEEVSRKATDKAHLKIFWRPYERISRYIPYVHTKKYFVPDDYDSFLDGGYIFDIIFDARHGQVTIQVDSHHPVAEAFAIMLPRFRRLTNLRGALRYALRTRERFGAPATISDRHRVCWSGSDFNPRRRYALFVFYEGYERILGPPKRALPGPKGLTNEESDLGQRIR